MYYKLRCSPDEETPAAFPLYIFPRLFSQVYYIYMSVPYKMASALTPIFCCPHITPYRPRILDQESKFNEFLEWALLKITSEISSDYDTSSPVPEYAVQLVKQVNYGPLESRRYFIPRRDLCEVEFIEVGEQWLIDNNFEKLNSYVYIVLSMKANC